MKHLSIISILVALCMIFTFVTPVIASDGTATLQGEVWDVITGLPIAGALVTIDGQFTTTDGDGAYSFTLDEGTYSITVAKDGYQGGSVSVVVVAGYIYTQDFALFVQTSA